MDAPVQGENGAFLLTANLWFGSLGFSQSRQIGDYLISRSLTIATVETDEQAHFVAKINNNNKNFKEQGNSAKKNNLESNLIVRPQCVSVWREKI